VHRGSGDLRRYVLYTDKYQGVLYHVYIYVYMGVCVCVCV